MINPGTAETVIQLATLLGQTVPTLVTAIRPLLSERDQRALQAALDASDARADAADAKAEKALKGD